jgi:hypothetical protein
MAARRWIELNQLTICGSMYINRFQYTSGTLPYVHFSEIENGGFCCNVSLYVVIFSLPKATGVVSRCFKTKSKHKANLSERPQQLRF